MLRSIIIGAFATALLGSAANAQTCGAYSYTLTNGQTADANQVMQNFSDIRNCANTKLAPIAGPGFTGNVSMAGAGATLSIADTAASGAARLIITDASNNSYSIGRNGSNGFLSFVGYQSTYSGFQWTTNSGIGMTINNAGYLGIGTASPGYVLTVNGTAYATGAAGALSDVRDKDAIKQLPDDALGIVAKLRPVSFRWKEPKDDGMRGDQMGFIAQEVEKVAPSMVLIGKDDRGSEALKYNEFIPLLTKAIQEQQAEITELKATVAALKSTPTAPR